MGVVAISATLSWLRGFVKEALSLLTWLSALVISYLFAPSLATLLADYVVLSSTWLFGLARIILFVSTLIVGSLVKNLFAELIKATGLKKTDRLLGVGFGVARGGLIVLLVIAGLRWFDVAQSEPWWLESQLIPVFSQFEENLLAWFQQQPMPDHSVPNLGNFEQSLIK